MAIGISFFLVYTKKKIDQMKLYNQPVSIRCQVRFTLSDLTWTLAKRISQPAYRIQITLPFQAIPRYWSSAGVKHAHPGAALINSKLDEISQRARTLHSEYVKSGKFPSDTDFAIAILGAQTATRESMFYQNWRDYIEYLENKGVTGALVGRQKYVMDLLIKFESQSKYRIEYQTLGKTFVGKFTSWCEKHAPKMRKQQDMAKTAQQYLATLKSFLTHAFSEGWTNEIIWRQIKPETFTKSFPITLTESDINKLWSITADDIEGSGSAKRNKLATRDWFLFASQTGQRYSDWQQGRFAIVDNMPAGMNIRFFQEKTGNPLEVPLSALAIDILKRNNMKMPDVVGSSSARLHLPQLIAIAGIKKKITTHTARRTFCTLQEKAGVPRSIIMRITGHRTEEDYLRYVGISFQYNADMLRKANPDWYDLKNRAG